MIFELILQFFIFIITLYISFYVPGKFILSLSKNSFNKTLEEFLAVPIGYSLFILTAYASSWIHIPFLPLVLLTAIVLWCFLKKREIFSFQVDRDHWLIWAIIIVGALAFTSLSFLSGLRVGDGMQFIGSVNSTDAIMHLARIKTQLYAFPPVYTGFAGYTMRGYHYFYDFLLSRFALFYGLTAEDLYYRLFPLFISFFYGVSVYVFSGVFTKNLEKKAFILFFAYFGTSFGFVLSFFMHGINAGNGFGLVQQQELVLDPSTIFSAALLCSAYYVLLLKKKNISHALLVGLIIGLLAQLKIYAGIIGISSLCIYCCYIAIRYKQFQFAISSLVVAFFLTAVTYLPNNLGVGQLLFSPFFIYDNFMKQDLFTPLHWETRMILYAQQHKIFHIFSMYLLAGIIFWTLALGSRILGVAYFLKAYQKNFWTEQNILLITTITIPLLLASIFVQSISIFDTVQFFWFVAIFMSIPAGLLYGKFFESFPKLGKYFLVVLLVFLSFGEVLYNEEYYIFHPHLMTISSANLAVLRSVQARVSNKDFFVASPSLVYNQNNQLQLISYPAPLFSALSGRRTYYEYEIPEFPIQEEVALRKERIETIAKAAEVCDGETVNQTMHLIGSDFLVTTQKVSCQHISHLQKIASSGEWTFWIVK